MTATLLASFPSPSQGVWFLGPFPVRAYALFIIAGIIAALVIGDRRWVARGGEPGVIYDIALWAVTFGLIGGRLYHVLTDWNTYFGPGGAGFVAALRIWDGGLGIWGAVALGGVGAWIACRREGIPLPAFGDAIAPGIILAQAIGRLGNYFNQELYGRETTLPWGLEIYERRNASGAVDYLNGVSTGQLLEVVHPTFLYELLWNLLVFVALLVIDRRFTIGHGRLFALYVAGYCVGRFWIELLRSDFATEFAGVRVNSFTATFVFIGAVVYIMVAPRGREDPATLRGKSEAEVEPAVEHLVRDVAVGATTSGVVAAATVAGADDRREEAADEELGEPAVGGVGSVEGDEIEAAVAEAPTAHEAAVEGEAEAEELVAEATDAEAGSEAPSAVLAGFPVDGADTAAGGFGSVEGDEAAEVFEAVAPAGDTDPEDGLAATLAFAAEAMFDTGPARTADTGPARTIDTEAQRTADTEAQRPQEAPAADADVPAVAATAAPVEDEAVVAAAGKPFGYAGDEDGLAATLAFAAEAMAGMEPEPLEEPVAPERPEPVEPAEPPQPAVVSPPPTTSLIQTGRGDRVRQWLRRRRSR
ncbi:prolipoprotein diacylglyceryl transferase [Mycolicibacterium vaccae]|uniref:prolipoprotein diacylglyceryl transferase n=1 Tax=Mycolicibacterium vaccae TaxID=1810 RepID=UPI003CFBD6E3